MNLVYYHLPPLNQWGRNLNETLRQPHGSLFIQLCKETACVSGSSGGKPLLPYFRIRHAEVGVMPSRTVLSAEGKTS